MSEIAQTVPGRRWRKAGRCCGCGCAGCFTLAAGLFVLFWLVLQKVPKTYPAAVRPIPPPARSLGRGLDGFDSPYLGHTGSWDGKGGSMAGTKVADMDAERGMGLRWTFMPVNWKAMEPNGPVDPDRDLPPAWKELDAFIVAAHDRGLNVLIQAPVVGGNAGGPPRWAGRRQPGKSAPANMAAGADFAGKLARRYAQGGALARREGWGNRYGVRAWELDNEPAEYFTSWAGQAGDYAEFVTLAAAEIRRADAKAVIVAPAIATGSAKYDWLEATLDPGTALASPRFRQAGKHYSIGPVTDVVSFHIYEGLDTAFSGRDRTIERAFSEVRDIFEAAENRSPGFTFARKQDYWDTEGSFDFFGVLPLEQRAAWRWQFFTRAFAAGIRKVIVMDAKPREQAAVRAYVKALPDPFPMTPALARVKVLAGGAEVFLHTDRGPGRPGKVWALWARAGKGPAEVEIPIVGSHPVAVSDDGRETALEATGNKVRISLPGDRRMAAPVLLIDRP